MVTRRCWSENN